MRSPTVYILILSWNGKRWLNICLNSVLTTEYPNYKVVVVDNGSADGSSEYIRSNFPEIKVIQNRKNLGFAEGNNIGIRYALKQGADYIILLNQDTKVDPYWLFGLVNVAENEKSYGILSPMQYDYEGKELDRNFLKLIRVCKIFDCSQVDSQMKEVYEVPYVIGSAMLITRELCEKVGLFDPLYFCYGEETDLCRRARFYGFKVGIVTASKIYHWHALVHTEEMSERSKMLFLRNQFLFLLKDPYRSFWENLKDYIVWGEAKKIIRRYNNKFWRGFSYVLRVAYIQAWILWHLPIIIYRTSKEKRQPCYL